MLVQRKTLAAILVAVSFILSLPTLALAGQFKIVRVTDGDTVLMEGCDITVRARLVGIDAPEASHKKGKKGQPYSERATKLLASLILNKTVDIKGYGLDYRYNRPLVEVYLNGHQFGDGEGRSR